MKSLAEVLNPQPTTAEVLSNLLHWIDDVDRQSVDPEVRAEDPSSAFERIFFQEPNWWLTEFERRKPSTEEGEKSESEPTDPDDQEMSCNSDMDTDEESFDTTTSRSSDEESVPAANQKVKPDAPMQEAAEAVENIPGSADNSISSWRGNCGAHVQTMEGGGERQKKSQEAAETAKDPSRSPNNLISSWGENCSLHIEDIGGGGDCLYKSVAAGLLDLQKQCPAKGRAILEQIQDGSITHRALRNLVARSYTEPEDENFHTTFLNRVLTWVNFENLEKSGTPEAWRDKFWSPLEIMELYFPFLAPSANAGNFDIKVNGVQLHPNGEADVSYTCDNFAMLNHMHNFSKYFENLRKHVHDVLSRCGSESHGHCHWGTDVDLKHLAKALDVGFILLCKHRRPAVTNHICDGWAYPWNFSRHSFSHWMLLYYEDEVHFQLAKIKTKSDQLFRCTFSKEEVLAEPKLLELYSVNNAAAPFGEDSEYIEDFS